MKSFLKIFWNVIVWINKHFIEIVCFAIPIITSLIFMVRAFYAKDILAVLYAGFLALIPLICYLIFQIKILVSMIREFRDFIKEFKK